ncbi:unnamed protein product, partial [marine sediment metagenome]
DANQCDAAGKIYGIGIQSDWQRYYPTGPVAAHVVGFTSSDNRGLAGVEFKYNEELTGKEGQNVLLADVHRRPIRRSSLVARVTGNGERGTSLATRTGWTSHAARDGVGIILTIDAAIQQFTRAQLLKQYESYEAESAVAIVAQPKTGAILAMVSLPDFEPEHIRLADANNFRNRAITDQFEPGSILKPIVAAIALDTGDLGPNEKIFCEYGSYHGKGFGQIGEYGNHRFGDLTV